MGEKETAISSLIKDWKYFYEKNIRIESEEVGYFIELIDLLFIDDTLRKLSDINFDKIKNLFYSIYPNDTNKLYLLNNNKDNNFSNTIKEIYNIFVQDSNIEIRSSLYFFSISYNLNKRSSELEKEIEKVSNDYKNNISVIENNINNEINNIKNRFTAEADNKYLYGVYRAEAERASRRIIMNQVFFYVLLIIMFGLELFMPKYTEYMGITINNDLISLAIRIILTIPMVWAILFVLRSIKEDRKIEQAYKHKELLTIIYENFHNRKDVNPKVLNTFEQIAVESLRLNPALLLDKSTAEKIPLEDLLMQIVSKNSEKSDDKQGQN